jgi:hypothetical protein
MQLLEGVKMLAAQGGGWSIQVQIKQCCRSGSGMGKIPDPGSGMNITEHIQNLASILDP